MSSESVVRNLTQAEDLLWTSSSTHLIPPKVAEAARLIEVAISQIEALEALEQALLHLSQLSTSQVTENIEDAKSLVRKAKFALEAKRDSRHFEWMTGQGVNADDFDPRVT